MVETNSIVQTLQNNQIPPIIINQDSSAFATSVILNKTNYPLWSQIMEIRIGSRNKAGYLTREAKKPPSEDPNYAIRITKNHKAKEIWEAVAKTFYDGSNETCLFELNQKSFSITQNDHRMTSQEKTVEGVVKLHSAMARLRVYIFLSVLDPEFDHVHGEILRKDPKLNLENIYAYLCYGSQNELNKDYHLTQQKLKVPSLIILCYEIIGYPEWWDFTKKSRKKVAGTPMMAATTEVQQNMEDKSQPTANITHPGIVGYFDPKDSWLWC
ncbi:hypothetical protein MANES_04G101050v8 [Manihot esculenta]|uniref:Uncharacterized protein n=1 Tax=Manihot esculenta TaxID=3983 RepID=A0ACB7HU25_MANES|nr:hypothetical protein MANES_04G101050v8 [Manihot esculenta]